jgi:hypothetical protein
MQRSTNLSPCKGIPQGQPYIMSIAQDDFPQSPSPGQLAARTRFVARNEVISGVVYALWISRFRRNSLRFFITIVCRCVLFTALSFQEYMVFEARMSLSCIYVKRKHSASSNLSMTSVTPVCILADLNPYAPTRTALIAVWRRTCVPAAGCCA